MLKKLGYLRRNCIVSVTIHRERRNRTLTLQRTAKILENLGENDIPIDDWPIIVLKRRLVVIRNLIPIDQRHILVKMLEVRIPMVKQDCARLCDLKRIPGALLVGLRILRGEIN